LDDEDKEYYCGSLQQGSKVTTTATITTSSRKQPPKGKCTLSKRDEVLSSKSHCTPRQVLAFVAEKNSADKVKQEAYWWTVAQVVERGKMNMGKASREALEQFNIDVLPGTVCKIVKSNGKTTVQPGPKGNFSEEELNTLNFAILIISCSLTGKL
jgi:hypothetical protein